MIINNSIQAVDNNRRYGEAIQRTIQSTDCRLRTTRPSTGTAGGEGGNHRPGFILGVLSSHSFDLDLEKDSEDLDDGKASVRQR